MRASCLYCRSRFASAIGLNCICNWIELDKMESNVGRERRFSSMEGLEWRWRWDAMEYCHIQYRLIPASMVIFTNPIPARPCLLLFAIFPHFPEYRFIVRPIQSNSGCQTGPKSLRKKRTQTRVLTSKSFRWIKSWLNQATKRKLINKKLERINWNLTAVYVEKWMVESK